jgi:hypothetical protein
MTDLQKPDSKAVAEALKRQKAYEDARQTRFGKGAEKITAPLGGMVGKLVPPELVRAGLEAADKLVGVTIPEGLTGHDLSDIAACEAAARRVQAWSVGTNAASGGVTGWFGAAGVAADIPATITLAARNVRATGAAFGFTQVSDEERAYRLMILETATVSAGANRGETLKNLGELADWMNTPEGRVVFEKGGDWVTDKVVERIARQLGVSLGSRKAGQVVPIVGGAVAAVVNASFQTDVSRASRYAYRLRWLMARKLLPEPEESS